jgi:hypothetical protein
MSKTTTYRWRGVLINWIVLIAAAISSGACNHLTETGLTATPESPIVTNTQQPTLTKTSYPTATCTGTSTATATPEPTPTVAPQIMDPNLREMIGNAVPERSADGGWVLRDGTGNIRFTYNEEQEKWEGIAPGETTIVSSITGVEYNLVRSPFNLMALNQEGEKLLDYAWWLALTGNDILDRPLESVSDDELRQYFAEHSTVDDFVYLKHSENSNIDGKPQDTPHDVEAVEVNGAVNTKKVDILVWTYGEEGASMGRVVNFVDDDGFRSYYIGTTNNNGEGSGNFNVQFNIVLGANMLRNSHTTSFIDGNNCSIEEGYSAAVGISGFVMLDFAVDRSAITKKGIEENGYVGGRTTYHIDREDQKAALIKFENPLTAFSASCIVPIK